MLDKLIGMQEKIDKMMMELEMKRARLEEKQMEIDIQMRREERISAPNDEYMLTCNTHGIYMSPPGAPSYPVHSTYGYGNHVAIVAIYRIRVHVYVVRFY